MANARTEEERWEHEKRAVTLKSSGLSIAKIASELNLSPDTVRKDLKMAYRRISDFHVLDGTALGVLISQCDHTTSLALGGFGSASRTVEVRVVERDGKVERERMTERDWYAAANMLGKAIESIRLKATILGFGARADMTPVLQFFAKGAACVDGDLNVEIAAEDLPKLRRHMREARRLLGRERVKTVEDAQRVLEAHGVKDAPDATELRGAVITDAPADKDGDGGGAAPTEDAPGHGVARPF